MYFPKAVLEEILFSNGQHLISHTEVCLGPVTTGAFVGRTSHCFR